MNDPHIWWYITRASAVIGWVLMTLSVLWGILLSTRILRKTDNPGWLRDLHSYFSGLAIAMVEVHMVSLMLDGWLHFSVLNVLVPFTTDYRPLAVALGIVAMYLLVAVQLTSLAMNKLPRAVWRAIHLSSYGSLMIVAFHAGVSGTDVGSSWYQALAVTLIAVVALAIVLRLLAGSREGAAATTAANRAAAMHEPPSDVVQSMVVVSVTPVANRVIGIRLVPLGGGTLPAWHPGAHITVRLGNGLERQYSLCGDPAERNHYDIAVLRTEDSAGGSEWIHANATPGMLIDVVGPLNHFELEAAFDYLFIAGGIGITPILAMIESLPQRRTWQLVYFGRSRTAMPFLDELLTRYPDRVFPIVSDEHFERPDVLSGIRASTAQVYCCGPESLMMSVADVVPVDRMHFERFTPVVRAALTATSVDVNCTKSNKQFSVAAGESILDAMKANSVPVFASCLKGVCGSCEVRVLSGTPEHLDSVMDDAEKDTLGIMYPCVSRATSSTLVLEA